MKVISFVNMKGGVGKSTLAVNFASCLAQRNSQKTLIIDMDPQFNATQCLINTKQYVEHKKSNKDTILNVFHTNPLLDVSIISGATPATVKPLNEVEPTFIEENLYLLPGDLSLHRIEMVAGNGSELRLKRFLDGIKDQNFDYVIIDTPPTPSIWMASSLIASDYYIIPLKPDPISVTGIDLLESIIEGKKANYDLKIKCLGVILNMVEEGTIVYRNTFDYLQSVPKWNKHLLASSIPKRVKIAQHQTNGRHILELGDDALSMRLAQMTDEIVLKIQENS